MFVLSEGLCISLWFDVFPLLVKLDSPFLMEGSVSVEEMGEALWAKDLCPSHGAMHTVRIRKKKPEKREERKHFTVVTQLPNDR